MPRFFCWTRGMNDKQDAGESTRRQLDALVVSVELTLVSIIQGVALSFLTESSRTAPGDLRFDQWPYVANGLMLILMFRSRSVAHAFTLIRWPLEFAHNFRYIACTLIEAITFTNLTDPLRWYAFNDVFAILAWFVFVVDLRRIVGQRQSEAAGPARRGTLWGNRSRPPYKHPIAHARYDVFEFVSHRPAYTLGRRCPGRRSRCVRNDSNDRFPRLPDL